MEEAMYIQFADGKHFEDLVNGSSNEIKFTVYNSLKGAIFTHNHPVYDKDSLLHTVLTSSDVENMRKGASQIRMVYNESGKKRTVYIDRNNLTRKQFGDFANSIQEKDKQVRTLLKIIKKRNYPIKEKQRRENNLVKAYDNIFTTQAIKYGIKYVKE